MGCERKSVVCFRTHLNHEAVKMGAPSVLVSAAAAEELQDCEEDVDRVEVDRQ